MFETTSIKKVFPNLSEAEIKALNTSYKPLSATQRIKAIV